MKTRNILFTSLSVLMSLGSCTKETIVKEEYNPNISVYGLWKVSGTNEFNYKFLHFQNSKNVIGYSENGGFKSTYNTNFVPYPEQLIADLKNYGSSTIFNYKVSNDTIRIMDGNKLFLTAVKSTSTEINDWVTPVSISESISGLFGTEDYMGGIGFDGTNILVPTYDDNKIHSVSPVSKTIVSTLTTAAGSLNTVEYDGTQYWSPRNGWSTVTRIKISDGSTLGTSVDIGGAWIYGAAYLSATQMALYANNGNTFYMYNPTTNAVAFSKKVDNIYFRDMAAYNSKVYVVTGNKIFKMDPAGFVPEKTYELSNYSGSNLNGIASAGGGVFWLFDSQTKELMKVTLP